VLKCDMILSVLANIIYSFWFQEKCWINDCIKKSRINSRF